MAAVVSGAVPSPITTTRSSASSLAGKVPPYPHRPWPRQLVTEATWIRLAKQLGGRTLDLGGPVGRQRRHPHGAAGQRARPRSPLPAWSAPPANSPRSGDTMLRRSAWSAPSEILFGYEPIGSPDDRPWLDHGRWPIRHPLGAAVRSIGCSSTLRISEGEG